MLDIVARHQRDTSHILQRVDRRLAGSCMSWDFSTEPEFDASLGWMREFVREQVFPLELLDLDRRRLRSVAAPLQEEVKAHGLWAAHLPAELGGTGFGQ